MNVDEELRAIIGKKAKREYGTATTLAEAGLDSLDVIEIAFDIEDRFKIQLPQAQQEMIAFTYGDLCQLVEKNIAAQTNIASITPESGRSLRAEDTTGCRQLQT